MAIPALFWGSVRLASDAIESDSDIWSVIQEKMKDAGLSNVKKNKSDVSGHSQDTIMAVTFVTLGPKDYMLYVMAAGAGASAFRDTLVKGLKNVKFL